MVHPGRRELARGGRGRLRSRRGPSGRLGLTSSPGSVPQPTTGPFPAGSSGPLTAGDCPQQPQGAPAPSHLPGCLQSLLTPGSAQEHRCRLGTPPPAAPRQTPGAWHRVVPEARGAQARLQTAWRLATHGAHRLGSAPSCPGTGPRAPPSHTGTRRRAAVETTRQGPGRPLGEWPGIRERAGSPSSSQAPAPGAWSRHPEPCTGRAPAASQQA